MLHNSTLFEENTLKSILSFVGKRINWAASVNRRFHQVIYKNKQFWTTVSRIYNPDTPYYPPFSHNLIVRRFPITESFVHMSTSVQNAECLVLRDMFEIPSPVKCTQLQMIRELPTGDFDLLDAKQFPNLTKLSVGANIKSIVFMSLFKQVSKLDIICPPNGFMSPIPHELDYEEGPSNLKMTSTYLFWLKKDIEVTIKASKVCVALDYLLLNDHVQRLVLHDICHLSWDIHTVYDSLVYLDMSGCVTHEQYLVNFLQTGGFVNERFPNLMYLSFPWHKMDFNGIQWLKRKPERQLGLKNHTSSPEYRHRFRYAFRNYSAGLTNPEFEFIWPYIRRYCFESQINPSVTLTLNTLDHLISQFTIVYDANVKAKHHKYYKQADLLRCYINGFTGGSDYMKNLNELVKEAQLFLQQDPFSLDEVVKPGIVISQHLPTSIRSM